MTPLHLRAELLQKAAMHELSLEDTAFPARHQMGDARDGAYLLGRLCKRVCLALLVVAPIREPVAGDMPSPKS
jgi:hypothetical protein